MKIQIQDLPNGLARAERRKTRISRDLTGAGDLGKIEFNQVFLGVEGDIKAG